MIKNIQSDRGVEEKKTKKSTLRFTGPPKLLPDEVLSLSLSLFSFSLTWSVPEYLPISEVPMSKIAELGASEKRIRGLKAREREREKRGGVGSERK